MYGRRGIFIPVRIVAEETWYINKIRSMEFIYPVILIALAIVPLLLGMIMLARYLKKEKAPEDRAGKAL